MYKMLSPDIVTMDITMPEMEGTEALKKIRSQHPSAKIIMCSAMGQQHIVVQAIQAGAKDFIVKPFHPDRVIEAINRVIQ
jgi:two-component system chemotaxis response regulator CheY